MKSTTALVLLLALPGAAAAQPGSAAGDRIRIASLAQYFGIADVAFSPERNCYVSVYVNCDIAGGPFALRSVTIDPATGALGNPVTIDTPASQLFTFISMSWNPALQRFLVVFWYSEGSDEIRGRLLDADGAPTGSMFSIGIGSISKVACDGAAWLVVWDGGRARIVTGENAFAGPVFSLGKDVLAPSVAFGARGDYLVVWDAENDPTGPFKPAAVCGRRVSPAGDLGEVCRYDTSSSPRYESDPTVVANPDGGFAVGWVEIEQAGPMDFPGTPVVCRVGPNGAALEAPHAVDGKPLDTLGAALGGTLSLAWNAEPDTVVASWMERLPDGTGYGVVAGELDRVLVPIESHIPLADGVDRFDVLRGARPSIAICEGGCLIQWSVWPGFNYSTVEARRFDSGPSAALAPTVRSATQVDRAGLPVAKGAETSVGFSVLAIADSSREFDVRFEIEVTREGGSGPSFHATSALSASGSTVTLPVDGLPRDAAYDWRCRAIDTKGRSSAWFGPAGGPDLRIRPNRRPEVSGVQQGVAGHAVSPGAKVLGLDVTATATDDDGDDVALLIEAQPVGRDFTNSPTWTGSPGAAGRSMLADLQLPPGAYHWQVSVVDVVGGRSDWTSFGGNGEESPDFILLPFGSTGISSACSAFPAGGVALLVILGLAIPPLRRA